MLEVHHVLSSTTKRHTELISDEVKLNLADDFDGVCGSHVDQFICVLGPDGPGQILAVDR